MPSPRTLNPGSDLAPPTKPGPDLYIGLLVLSLVAQVAAALFLFMDYNSYPDGKPTAVQAPAAIGANAPAAPTQPSSGGGGVLGGGAAPTTPPPGAPPQNGGGVLGNPPAPAAPAAPTPPPAPPKK